jgi:16S rRNA (cytosine1402-N4)-methyltransferase
MVIQHKPVMIREVLQHLLIEGGAVYVDGTVGEGGHAHRILDESGPDVRLIGLDRDADALGEAAKRLAPYGERVTLVQSSYADLEEVLDRLSIQAVSGILLDLGFSSFQINNPRRGMSFMSPERLDMRYDTRQKTTAYDLVNELSRRDLKELMARYGEQRWAGKIASAIVRRRSEAPIERAADLADIVSKAIPHVGRRTGIHPATLVFQALRIAVNKELEHLERFLDTVPERLQSGGRIVVISYHSLEDRAVKNSLRDWASSCRCPKDLPQCVCGGRQYLRILTPRPVFPGDEEAEENPRARSARLRAAERI